MPRLTAVSMFSGCGGFDWGAAQAGVDIIWANDIDPHAQAMYQALLPGVPFILGDVRHVAEFPRADILIGCYPCTGFSGASRRRWHDRRERKLKSNTNNYLYREFMRALRQVRPRYLFVENVGGMATAEDGWFLEQQLRGFRRLGYKIKRRVLNAADYGVAQTRKRMFIVGVLGGRKPLEYQFPEASFGLGTGRPTWLLRDAIGRMAVEPSGEYFDYPFHGHYLTRNRKRAWDEPSFTIVADKHHVPLHPAGEPMVFVKKDTWALRGQFNRRLSWRECAAIQGLPADIDLDMSLESKYRVIGNAVPPALGRVLLEPVVRREPTTVPAGARRPPFPESWSRATMPSAR